MTESKNVLLSHFHVRSSLIYEGQRIFVVMWTIHPECLVTRKRPETEGSAYEREKRLKRVDKRRRRGYLKKQRMIKETYEDL